MRTGVYIDGYNLYYGCLRGSPHRWLDLEALSRRLLNPSNDLTAIKYFTARVSARPDDPSQPVRQQTYLRALATLPLVSITFGQFQSHPQDMLLETPRGKQRFARVIRTEEKGSDVNLATHMLSDIYERRVDAAVLITNDSDLAEPVRLVSQDLKRVVGIINPGHKHPSAELRRYATFFKEIRRGALQASQFPEWLTDSVGRFHKPSAW
jgi:uncharacterized LabA/DUF88 family protein